MTRGKFITFEGVEGAGKSAQTRLLREALEARGIAVRQTREPGGDPVAEGVRALALQYEMSPRTELLLFLAARAQNVDKTVLPSLLLGETVLCDRFADSTIAYQGYARGLGRDLVAQFSAFAARDLTPDLTFLLDLAPEEGLSRQQDRNRMEAEGIAFHHAVRQGFLEEAKRNPHRFCVIDATQTLEEIHLQILAATLRLLERQDAS